MKTGIPVDQVAGKSVKRIGTRLSKFDVGKHAMHILIVEDDPVVADVLGMTLEEAGHFQSTAHNIETALAELKHHNVDAVLLDINLPDGDGTRLARLIRKNHIPVPILVVSGNASTDDKIAALGAGADGYLTKPFDRFELLANLDAIMRRTHGHSSATVAIGNLEVDLNRHLALVDGEALSLTGKEFRIVEFLALRKGSVLSKTAFLSHLYGGMDEPEPKIIDVFICKLRRKLELAGARGVSIDTVWGQGYILRETEAINQLVGDLPDTIASVDADEAQARMPSRRRGPAPEQRLTAS